VTTKQTLVNRIGAWSVGRIQARLRKKKKLKEKHPQATSEQINDVLERTKRHIQPSESREKAMDFASTLIVRILAMQPPYNPFNTT
jgi:hypothetical protein